MGTVGQVQNPEPSPELGSWGVDPLQDQQGIGLDHPSDPLPSVTICQLAQGGSGSSWRAFLQRWPLLLGVNQARPQQPLWGPTGPTFLGCGVLWSLRGLA